MNKREREKIVILLLQIEEKLSEATQKNTNIPAVFRVPVEVDQENMTLNWTVESKSEV